MKRFYGRKAWINFVTAWCIAVIVMVGGTGYAQPWQFALISDTHDSDKANTPDGVTPYLAPIVKLIMVEKPDFVIETGDLITGVLTKKTSPAYRQYDRQYGAFQQRIVPLEEKGIPFFSIRGNHDYGRSDEETAVTLSYQKNFASRMPQNGPADAKGLTYSFVHNQVKFILLDQYVNAHQGNVTLPMEWLKEELANREGAELIFVFGHSPAYALKKTDQDKENNEQENHFNLFDQPELRDRFWQLLQDAKVPVYISGHKHLYCRGNALGIEQIVIGDLGSSSAYNPKKADKYLKNLVPGNAVSIEENRPGYMVIRIDDGEKRITAREYWLQSDGAAYLYDTYSCDYQ